MVAGLSAPDVKWNLYMAWLWLYAHILNELDASEESMKLQRVRSVLRRTVRKGMKNVSSITASAKKKPIVKATKIFDRYVASTYFPSLNVPLASKAFLTPPLLFIEYLVYRADEVAERQSDINLASVKGSDYEKLYKYKKILEKFLRIIGAWNEKVSTQVENGEKYLRCENLATSGELTSREDAIKLIELRPSDVRLLREITSTKLRKKTSVDLENALWSAEVLADIGNDLEQYSQDLEDGKFNIISTFITLYGTSAHEEIQALIDHYRSRIESSLRRLDNTERMRVREILDASNMLGVEDVSSVISTVGPLKATKSPSVSYPVVATGALCVFAWMAAYAAIIYRGYSDRTYGVPVPALAANLSWEFIYGFILDPFGDHIHALSIPCFFIDLIIAWQTWKYGTQEAHSPWVKRNFHRLLVVTIMMAGPLTYYGFKDLEDPDGEYTGFAINLIMSLLFIAMLVRRGTPAGQSMYVALFKWIGTLLAWVATALTVTTSPEIPLPRNLCEFLKKSLSNRRYPLTPLINVMYAITFTLDITYSAMLYRSIRAAGLSPWRRF
jgi:hypothetical protein